jgi:protein associated with RNAse G/E
VPFGRTVDYVIEKWGGHEHYRGDVSLLGEDEHGAWLWGPKGRTIRRDGAPVFETRQDSLFLLPPATWWALSWWPGHEAIELYVNIQSPAVWADGRVTTVDVDLDVIRFLDGRVEVVDRDEFELHQRRYGYPEDLVATTERVTAEAFDLVVANAPPFDGVLAREWIERARG